MTCTKTEFSMNIVKVLFSLNTYIGGKNRLISVFAWLCAVPCIFLLVYLAITSTFKEYAYFYECTYI